MLGTMLVVILILALLGALPRWSHSRSWGYAPIGGARSHLGHRRHSPGSWPHLTRGLLVNNEGRAIPGDVDYARGYADP